MAYEMKKTKKIDRRKFIGDGSKFIAASTVIPFGLSFPTFENTPTRKLKVALVGTGGRGSSTWGKDLVDSYSDYVEMVGL